MKNIPQGLKPRVDSTGVMPRLKPWLTSKTSFSAACEALAYLKNQFSAACEALAYLKNEFFCCL
jgi:hypothetical protein